MPDLTSPPPDPEAMRLRLAAAEQRYLDGVTDVVTERLHAYVLCVGGCPSKGEQR